MKDSKSYQQAKADLAFSMFIRIRDANEPCISCGRYFPFDEIECGHFRTKAAAPSLRYDEDNAHGQCRDCNSGFKSGNRLAYRESLIAKIGLDRVEVLESSNKPVRQTAADVFEIRKHYEQIVKNMEPWE
ncbi:recombination protein NinG [Photobacterium damselae subsp. damselae]|uniref:recombination protein NinG n=1 Tax=Photobacterium damselae TaxID=38293 RepID=UPI00311B35C1